MEKKPDSSDFHMKHHGKMTPYYFLMLASRIEIPSSGLFLDISTRKKASQLFVRPNLAACREVYGRRIDEIII